jgi:hypothetical protein
MKALKFVTNTFSPETELKNMVEVTLLAAKTIVFMARASSLVSNYSVVLWLSWIADPTL